MKKTKLMQGGKIIVYQEQDSCSSNTGDQSLSISLEDAGGGKYLVLSSSRWAIDPDEINSFASFLMSIANLEYVSRKNN